MVQSRYSGLGLKTGRWDQGATRSRACDPLLGVSPVKSLVNCFDILGWYRAILSASCAILRKTGFCDFSTKLGDCDSVPEVCSLEGCRRGRQG